MRIVLTHHPQFFPQDCPHQLVLDIWGETSTQAFVVTQGVADFIPQDNTRRLPPNFYPKANAAVYSESFSRVAVIVRVQARFLVYSSAGFHTDLTHNAGADFDISLEPYTRLVGNRLTIRKPLYNATLAVIQVHDYRPKAVGTTLLPDAPTLWEHLQDD